MDAGKLQRLPECEREPESVRETEREREHPAAPEARRDQILERHVENRRGNQRVDERRKPDRARRHVVGRRDQRHRVRDRERGDDRDERARIPERNDQAEQKQQVIGAGEDVREAVLKKPPRRLRDVRIEPHQAGIVAKLERAHRAIGRKELQDRQHADAKLQEVVLDREVRSIRLD